MGTNCDYSLGLKSGVFALYTNANTYHPKVEISLKNTANSDTLTISIDSSSQYYSSATSSFDGSTVMRYNIENSISGTAKITTKEFYQNNFYIGDDPKMSAMNDAQCTSFKDSLGAVKLTFCTISTCQ